MSCCHYFIIHRSFYSFTWLVINSVEMNKYLKFLMRETVRILTRPSMKGLRKCPGDVVIYSVWNIPT